MAGETFDVAVVGGGPAGYAAALSAAELGATVALIEAERPGGSCVNYACIPTNILLDTATTHLAARELAIHGVFEAGDRFHFGRAAARKDTLVHQLASGIEAALRMRKVTLMQDRASFSDEHALALAGGGTVQAEAIVIATGCRWTAPEIPRVEPSRVVTPDVVQSFVEAPASAVVLADGHANISFGVEYASLLALAGASVALVTSGERLLPGLDAALGGFVTSALEDLGIHTFVSAAVEGEEAGKVTISGSTGTEAWDAEVVVVGDPRQPSVDGLGLERAGIEANPWISVDRSARTNVSHIFAAGDITGGALLSSVASHMGEVAGANAAGDGRATHLDRIPHVLHGVPQIGWVGLTEQAAREAGRDVVTGSFDLSYNARALVLGARPGIVKVVADATLGEVLGVHAVGPDAAEIIAVATAFLQAEIPLADLASLVSWHPGVTEGLVEAARRAAGGA